MLLLKIIHQLKPRQCISKCFGLERNINALAFAIILVREQQLIVLETKDFDLPRRKVLPRCSDPVIIFNLCLMHDHICTTEYSSSTSPVISTNAPSTKWKCIWFNSSTLALQHRPHILQAHCAVFAEFHARFRFDGVAVDDFER